MPFGAPRGLDWEREGQNWPHRAQSRFVTAGGLRWHVQIMGDGHRETMLLLHGTGASTHSYRKLMPLLAQRFRVIACDLPGHGFTGAAPRRMRGLPGMAEGIARLLETLGEAPRYGVGHSAGAAILLRMALDGALHPARLFGINSALAPIEGNALLSPLAKLLFLNPVVPHAFAMQARLCNNASRLLKLTGSRLDAEDRDYYRVLIENPGHAAGALGMMAHWDLRPMLARLPQLEVPVTLLVAENDKMVPPATSRNAAPTIPDCEIVGFSEGGHLLHEVDPESVAAAILERTRAETGK